MSDKRMEPTKPKLGTPLLSAIKAACILILAVTLSACGFHHKPGIGDQVSWDELPGWLEDSHAEAWPALLSSCTKLDQQSSSWQALCAAARAETDPDNLTARHFFESWFKPHRLYGSGWRNKGLITGYYEPLLYGSLKPSDRYRYPIYRRPSDLVQIRLGDLYPRLKGKTVRGKLAKNQITPYFDRKDIDSDKAPLQGLELAWVDDPVALFFLHVQGSGKIQLEDGSILGVGYADQNGHPYTSIGKLLIEQGELTKEEVSLFTIREWLRANQDKAQALLHSNASYIFFRKREFQNEAPIGSLNVPLTPARSIAVDPQTIPLGLPVWLDTTLPGKEKRPLRRLTIAQDTGGAIKGFARADIFWGNGSEAERLAGEMKQEAVFYVLLPRD